VFSRAAVSMPAGADFVVEGAFGKTREKMMLATLRSTKGGNSAEGVEGERERA